MITTKFTLIKDNLTCHTNLLSVVHILRKLGWKVKVSELGQLI